MEKLNIVIVGYGGMGFYHGERLRKIGSYNLAGICDIDPQRKKLARENGLRVFESKEEVGNCGEVDAVLIATPNDLHRELTQFFAKKKKHVLCEKPAAITSADYSAMVKSAEGNGVKLSVNQNRRCDDDFLLAKEIISSGVIGKVYRIESRVNGANGIPGGWRKDETKGGGMLLDWGVHIIDQIALLADSKIKNSYCSFSHILGFAVDDGFSLRLEYENGFTAITEVDTNSFINLPRWMLYGENGTAQIDGFEAKGKIIVDYDNLHKPDAEAKGNGLTVTMADRHHATIREIEVPKIKSDYDKIYNNFYDICKNGAQQYVSHAQVLNVLEIMENAKKSDRRNI